MDYAALKAEIAMPAYAKMTDAEIGAALVAQTVEIRSLVARGVLRQAFDMMADTNGVPIWEYVEQHKADADTLGVACRAAIRLRDAPGDYPPIDMTGPMIVRMIGTMAQLPTGAPLLTAEQHDAPLALGLSYTSRAAQIGCPELAQIDVESAVYHIKTARAS